MAGVMLSIMLSCAVQPSSYSDAPEAASGPSCRSDTDCVASDCCHSSSCVPISEKPVCAGVMCTMDCRPGTMDCGQGSCACKKGLCATVVEGYEPEVS